MKKVLVLLNMASGTLANSTTRDEPQRIQSGFASRGVAADVRDVKGADLVRQAQAAVSGGYDAVIAGGGDGTLNAIANAVAGSEVAFGVLPLGTHNHFAKELGVPLDLDAAVAALATGEVRPIDVAEVNGQVFLNFSGIGLHPQVVRARDAEHTALRRSPFLRTLLRRSAKPFAMLIAFVRSLGRLPLLRVEINSGTIAVRRLTPSVIVCNNPYQMEVFGVRDVSDDDRGQLNLYVARSRGPIGLVRLLLRAMFRKLGAARDFEVLSHPQFTLATRRGGRRTTVSVDGELVEMSPPLRYKVRPGGLRVIVPRAG